MSAPPLLLRVLLAACAGLTVPAAHAQSSLPPEPVPLDTPAAFRPLSANWKLAGDVAGDPRHDKVLSPAAGTGVLVCNPGKDKETRGHLFTAWDHGDLELDLEFLLTPGSNSGVYLQGRYEVQLFDSWGVAHPKYGDCGGIYQRWDPSRGPGHEGYEGTPPKANACRAPGLWQRLHLEFQAPRFDAAGKKTRNARFVKVVLNGFTIHENVEVTGPTRSAAFSDEQPLGPLMIQGDHGPVALRRIAVKRFDAAARIAVQDLHYRLYSGEYKAIGAYDQDKPKAEGTPARFALGAIEKTGKFALVFTGTLQAPHDGLYRFAIESPSMNQLTIDDRPVVQPLDRGSQPGIIRLAAGAHPFRADMIQATNARPSFELVAEGPGLAPRTLTVRDDGEVKTGRRGGARAGGGANAKQLIVEPKDRVLVQRTFVPFDPRKRLYAAAVGSPAGVHFAYDLETASLLHVWRGSFVDAFQMWEGRGNDQTAKPAGPALTFGGKPAIALIEYAANGDWPTQPEALWSSQGYVVERDGAPTFLGQLSEIAVRDHIVATDGKSLTRTLQFKGKVPSWSAWMLLAEADAITPQPDGHGWIIGDREWYLDWPADAPRHPVIRTINGHQQLAVPLTTGNLEKPLTYAIVW